MIMNLYAIKDELNGFTWPTPIPNDEMAKRHLREMITNNPSMKIEPKDFSIWRIGEFNTETGLISNNNPKMLERG